MATPMMQERRAALYLRISQDRTGQQAGVSRQEEDCRDLAVRNDLEVVEVLTDNDTSAYSRRRPGFEQLVESMKAGRITDVIVWHTDRLYRRPRDLEDLVDLIDATGVQIHTVRAGRIDLATAAGRMQARMLGVVAAYEGEIKGERISRAAEQRARAGRFSGGMRPFGYEADGVTVRQDEADVLAQAFADLVAGVALGEIARTMNDTGITTSTGRPWTARMLGKMMRSPRFAGLATHQGAVVGPADWPAIVDESTWRSAVRILTDPSRRTTPGPTPRHLLSGVAECGVCGAACRASATGGKRLPRYRCAAGHVTRSKPQLEEYVVDMTVAVLEREQVVPISGPAEETAAEAADIRARLDDLAAAFAAGEITREQMATASSALRARLEQAESTVAAQTRTSTLVGLTGPRARVVWEGLPLERQRAVLREMWGTIVLVPLPNTGRKTIDPDGVVMTPTWVSA